MAELLDWIIQHGEQAHWLIFAGALVAGLSIPISIDILIMASGILAATVVPHHTLHLFLAIFLGCYFSAAMAYWIGRMGGKKLLKIKWFAKLLTQERLQKIQQFYQKRGLITLILGRFIPFGARNCIFLTIGACSFSFRKFLIWDLLAVSIWSSSCFYLFYKLGENYQVVLTQVQKFHFLLLICLGVTLITWIWYKCKKKKITETPKL